ncbi:PAS domain-containing protein [Streptomyces marincola]|uniref:PAS domain-containing protein n=1 Tax=Streptomyces marincola TaxID=2878388 RepID=UPI00210033C7|nr:PAS domain-containing protein [Streptomyces marincola]
MTTPSDITSAHDIRDDHLLAALLDGMDAALFAVDGGGRITHWNRQAERLLGWTAEQAVGRKGLGGWAVRDADAADVNDRLLRVLRAPGGGGPRQVQEFPLLRRDGGRVLVRAQVTAVRGPDGRGTGAYCAFSEVHAQLDLERNLALSEALLTDAAWAVLVVDADLRTVAANDRAARSLDATPVDMLGEPLGEFIGAGIEELEGALEHTLAGQAPDGPVEMWLTLREDDCREDEYGLPVPRDVEGGERCLLGGFLRLGSPLAAQAAPLGVAWVFQDVTRTRRAARRVARRAFRDGQLGRAARAAAECADPMEAARLHLHYALPGFAEHALLDVVGTQRDPARAPALVRIAQSPEADAYPLSPEGVAVRYGAGHPAPQAVERGVPVRVSGASDTAAWAAEQRWPEGTEHALCVPLRSRGRGLGALTFLRGAGRRPFDRADTAFAEDVALRLAACVDLARATGGS